MIKKYQIHHSLSEIFIGMGDLSEGIWALQGFPK
jgi:hypothetical protein